MRSCLGGGGPSRISGTSRKMDFHFTIILRWRHVFVTAVQLPDHDHNRDDQDPSHNPIPPRHSCLLATNHGCRARGDSYDDQLTPKRLDGPCDAARRCRSAPKRLHGSGQPLSHTRASSFPTIENQPSWKPTVDARVEVASAFNQIATINQSVLVSYWTLQPMAPSNHASIREPGPARGHRAG